MSFFLNFIWTDPSRDLWYESELSQIHKRVKHRVNVLRGFRQWKYWNYAVGWQDVCQDYGHDVYGRLKDVVNAFDPDRIFFWLQVLSFDLL